MKLYLLLFVNLFLLNSCKKYKPADAAFFIRSTQAGVSVSSVAAQGSNSSKITDLFLYVDGQFQGVYPVGNLMPVISKNQAVTINVFAGIKNNGIGTTRIPYPSYDFITFDTLVASGKTIERAFTFKYGSGVKFEWLENFDSGTGYTVKKSANNSDINFRIASAADSFEGKSLELTLGDTAQAQIESTISYPLPRGSTNVYLEINYKSTAPFTVGLIGDGEAAKSAFIVNPQPNWNKIYILLSETVSSSPVSEKYRVYFRMVNTGDYANPKLFLDNIKLLHFS